MARLEIIAYGSGNFNHIKDFGLVKFSRVEKIFFSRGLVSENVRVIPESYYSRIWDKRKYKAL